MGEGALTPLVSFAIVVALIPVALWLLKRTPMGGAAQGQAMRTVGVLPLSASQRVVTVEVGQGLDRRWLVLGVTGQSITTLYTMSAQDAPALQDAAVPTAAPAPTREALGEA